MYSEQIYHLTASAKAYVILAQSLRSCGSPSWIMYLKLAKQAIQMRQKLKAELYEIEKWHTECKNSDNNNTTVEIILQVA